MLRVVGSSLKMVKFFSQHFRCCMMLYSFAHVRATLLRRSTRTSSVCAIQHVATGWPDVCNMLGHVVPNNVAICCVEMLRAFGQLLHNILQHGPTMLPYAALKGCECLAGALQHDPTMLRYVAFGRGFKLKYSKNRQISGL